MISFRYLVVKLSRKCFSDNVLIDNEVRGQSSEAHIPLTSEL